MPIDIKLLRDKPDLIRDSERRRFRDECTVDHVLELDSQWRKEVASLNDLRRDMGTTQKQISAQRKASGGSSQQPGLMEQKTCLEQQIQETSARTEELQSRRDRLLRVIGNVLHGAVPTSRDENDNAVIRSWGRTGAPAGKTTVYWEAMKMLGAYDSERGVKVAGKRGYFLQGAGVTLNMALHNYGMTFLAGRGYLGMQPPYFMRSDVMAQTAELQDFEEQLYPVLDGDYFLIATSEQPLSAYHQDEQLRLEDLPLRYAAVSPCFRRETGKSGLDAKGLFRVHQFDKVEQFCITSPDRSWEMHEEMIATCEEFYQSLGIPYRIVEIASGALNGTAARKYDLEGWFPANGEYRELVSCSNCTDFQARALGVTVRMDGGPKTPVHMLNATLCATQRTMCCLVENNWTEHGMKIPRVLVPYMRGMEMLSLAPGDK